MEIVQRGDLVHCEVHVNLIEKTVAEHARNLICMLATQHTKTDKLTHGSYSHTYTHSQTQHTRSHIHSLVRIKSPRSRVTRTWRRKEERRHTKVLSWKVWKEEERSNKG